MGAYLIILFGFIILAMSACGQIFMKMGAVREKNRYGFNKSILLGLFFFAGVIPCNIYLLKCIQIKYFSIIISLVYLSAYVSGILIFKEKTNFRGISGIILVSMGLIIFNL